MDDLLSQQQIDDLLKQYLEPSKNENKKDIWHCGKCKKEFEQLKMDDDIKKFKFGKHAVINNPVGITSFFIYDQNGNQTYKGATSEGATVICLKCGYREIFVSRR